MTRFWISCAIADVSPTAPSTRMEQLAPPHCHRGLGTLYVQTGCPELARTALIAAMALYRAMDMTFWSPQVEIALAQMEG